MTDDAIGTYGSAGPIVGSNEEQPVAGLLIPSSECIGWPLDPGIGDTRGVGSYHLLVRYGVGWWWGAASSGLTNDAAGVGGRAVQRAQHVSLARSSARCHDGSRHATEQGERALALYLEHECHGV